MPESLYLVVKVSKRAKKVPKKATNWTYNAFSKKKFFLANLKFINCQNMMKKYLVSLYNFRSYFFRFTEVEASFLNLLPRATHNFIKPKLALFC